MAQLKRDLSLAPIFLPPRVAVLERCRLRSEGTDNPLAAALVSGAGCGGCRAAPIRRSRTER
jgi:hypothetical protein